MSRSCQCGGVIRESGKPYWDILPSCTCANPVITNSPFITTWTTDTAALSPQPRTRKQKGTDAIPTQSKDSEEK